MWRNLLKISNFPISTVLFVAFHIYPITADAHRLHLIEEGAVDKNGEPLYGYPVRVGIHWGFIVPSPTSHDKSPNGSGELFYPVHLYQESTFQTQENGGSYSFKFFQGSHGLHAAEQDLRTFLLQEIDKRHTDTRLLIDSMELSEVVNQLKCEAIDPELLFRPTTPYQAKFKNGWDPRYWIKRPNCRFDDPIDLVESRRIAIDGRVAQKVATLDETPYVWVRKANALSVVKHSEGLWPSISELTDMNGNHLVGRSIYYDRSISDRFRGVQHRTAFKNARYSLASVVAMGFTEAPKIDYRVRVGSEGSNNVPVVVLRIEKVDEYLDSWWKDSDLKAFVIPREQFETDNLSRFDVYLVRADALFIPESGSEGQFASSATEIEHIKHLRVFSLKSNGIGGENSRFQALQAALRSHIKERNENFSKIEKLVRRPMDGGWREVCGQFLVNQFLTQSQRWSFGY